jgi:hypothetical protein
MKKLLVSPRGALLCSLLLAGCRRPPPLPLTQVSRVDLARLMGGARCPDDPA